jgi:hypothetical protein
MQHTHARYPGFSEALRDAEAKQAGGGLCSIANKPLHGGGCPQGTAIRQFKSRCFANSTYKLTHAIREGRRGALPSAGRGRASRWSTGIGIGLPTPSGREGSLTLTENTGPARPASATVATASRTAKTQHFMFLLLCKN